MNQKTITNNRVELRKFIIHWNNSYPLDYLWRKKYGVAFGSQEHRQMSFIDMMFDLEEEVMMNNLFKKRNENFVEKKPENYISDDEFDNLDIEQFNNKEE